MDKERTSIAADELEMKTSEKSEIRISELVATILLLIIAVELMISKTPLFSICPPN